MSTLTDLKAERRELEDELQTLKEDKTFQAQAEEARTVVNEADRVHSELEVEVSKAEEAAQLRLGFFVTDGERRVMNPQLVAAIEKASGITFAEAKEDYESRDPLDRLFTNAIWRTIHRAEEEDSQVKELKEKKKQAYQVLTGVRDKHWVAVNRQNSLERRIADATSKIQEIEKRDQYHREYQSKKKELDKVKKDAAKTLLRAIIDGRIKIEWPPKEKVE